MDHDTPGAGRCDCAIQFQKPASRVEARLMAALAAPPLVALPPPKRRRIWELSSTYHCSIVGTCLASDELHRLLRKLGMAPVGASEHELHGRGVGLAMRDDQGGKLLNKALDERHSGAVRRFGAARDAAALRNLWSEALEAGDIRGAYWATMSHPWLDTELTRDAFGAVHMLSHLVGAANRADIRRLVRQEQELAELREAQQRQQLRLDELVEERNGLRSELAGERSIPTAPEPAPESAELLRQLEAAERRAATAELRRKEAEAEAGSLRGKAEAAGQQAQELRERWAEAEAALALQTSTENTASLPAGVRPATILYVGGLSGHVAALREHAARLGINLLHHDGGQENGSAQLPGLVSRAELVMFPVDCISHDAALTVKRLCRGTGIPYRPLRSAGISSFLASLPA